ncbi:GntR family transcriptional regulator [Amycolatopsis jejuensis]|uniref:GntR family transcriptional regulator n=1 Tax=Amycolatopsis jejuensis TaxID=330084 RepID=UPI000AC4D6CD|nr:GntR family transcriptional regulator [Amycolatopsis jejuensis]
MSSAGTGPAGDPVVPLTVVTTVDAVAAHLTERILNADLETGARLRESALAVDYNVSRHTLRAALARLTSAGLLVYGSNKGWRVRELNKDDFADIAFLRLGLELHALRAVAERGTGIGPAKQSLGEMLAMTEDTSWVRRLVVDMQFHRELVDEAGSPRLSAAYRDTQLSLHLYLVQRRDWFEPKSLQEWKDLHERLATTVESGDPERVEAVLRAQLAYSLND